jgi:predicted 3-demethylubiquinone-9 3-methyltransferase (glyoxalase superfamily)
VSKITPCFWFNGEAEAAACFYVNLFPDGKMGDISRYGADMPFPAGTAMMVEFSLAGQSFQALNGGPQFTHSEALSLSVACDTQAEVDRYWDTLITNGGSENRCSWLKDKFGISWQIITKGLAALMTDPDPARRNRAVGAMMQMKKLDIAAMQAAADAN